MMTHVIFLLCPTGALHLPHYTLIMSLKVAKIFKDMHMRGDTVTDESMLDWGPELLSRSHQV